jgi:PPK2 family polyphosphate:nucleotide phosphotransferase
MTDRPYLVPFDNTFKIARAATTADGITASDKQLKKELRRTNDRLYSLQRKLYAHNRFAVLLIFQAMDAAGKDSTIRHVMRGVNPAGCQVFSFKQPSSLELDHDFLWRSAARLPERGRIGIFNRSYYEETLVVRVHPEYLERQNLPESTDMESIWEDRFRSIRDHERHLADNGTRIIKFWMKVSRKEQKNRFLARLRDPAKNWKFSAADLKERKLWDSYMAAYENMLNATSRPYAPWYAIPADNKPCMRLIVANIVADAVKSLGCHYPQIPEDEVHDLKKLEQELENE